jgi:uncharacterized cupin superfamily protein
VGYRVVHAADLAWEERTYVEGQAPRRTADVTTPAGLARSRARVWRLQPHTRGRRHREAAQEEVFVVLEGTLTMLLGDPPERVDLAPRSVVSVEPGTGLQLRNETGAEVVVFAYGAPPIVAQAEYLDDVEQL